MYWTKEALRWLAYLWLRTPGSKQHTPLKVDAKFNIPAMIWDCFTALLEWSHTADVPEEPKSSQQQQQQQQQKKKSKLKATFPIEPDTPRGRRAKQIRDATWLWRMIFNDLYSRNMRSTPLIMVGVLFRLCNFELEAVSRWYPEDIYIRKPLTTTAAQKKASSQSTASGTTSKVEQLTTSKISEIIKQDEPIFQILFPVKPTKFKNNKTEEEEESSSSADEEEETGNKKRKSPSKKSPISRKQPELSPSQQLNIRFFGNRIENPHIKYDCGWKSDKLVSRKIHIYPVDQQEKEEEDDDGQIIHVYFRDSVQQMHFPYEKYMDAKPIPEEHRDDYFHFGFVTENNDKQTVATHYGEFSEELTVDPFYFGAKGAFFDTGLMYDGLWWKIKHDASKVKFSVVTGCDASDGDSENDKENDKKKTSKRKKQSKTTDAKEDDDETSTEKPPKKKKSKESDSDEEIETALKSLKTRKSKKPPKESEFEQETTIIPERSSKSVIPEIVPEESDSDEGEQHHQPVQTSTKTKQQQQEEDVVSEDISSNSSVDSNNSHKLPKKKQKSRFDKKRAVLKVGNNNNNKSKQQTESTQQPKKKRAFEAEKQGTPVAKAVELEESERNDDDESDEEDQ